MQEYANCFSNTGTQIPKLPPHPEGEGMLGFLNPLLNKKLPEAQCCLGEDFEAVLRSGCWFSFICRHWFKHPGTSRSHSSLSSFTWRWEKVINPSHSSCSFKTNQVHCCPHRSSSSPVSERSNKLYTHGVLFFGVFFLILTDSRGQSHVGGVWSPLWPEPWMRVEF